jgi:hypothetical protein
MSDYIVILGQAPPVSATAPVTGQPPDPGIVPQAPKSSGLPGGAAGGAVTITLLLAVVIVAWWAVKYGKGKLRDVTIGACLGVLGGSGIIGTLVWTVIGLGVKMLQAAGQALAS